MNSTRILCWLVHLYTASGVVVAMMTLNAGLQGDYPRTFLLMVLAVLIDATDGPLARRFNVKENVPQIDGRKLDDIADYANYTFVPLVLLPHAGWLPEPGWLWAGIALVASLFTFAHCGAKENDAGFFRGFPSYWNIVFFYVAVVIRHVGGGVVLAVIMGLSVLSVLPVRFVYPNRAPRWKPAFVYGGYLWMVTLFGLIWQYPNCDGTLLGLSLVYPACYVVASWYLAAANRRLKYARDRVT